jgi:hypothetical protein
MKHIFLTVLTVFCLSTVTATAQTQGEEKRDVQKHELSIYGTGGYSSLSCTLPGSDSKSGSTGGGAGLGYTFNISPSLGINTGIEMTAYGSEVSFGSISGEYDEKMGEYLLKFSYSLKNYKEVQSLTLFSVPVMAQYSLPLGSGGSMKFYASGGFKFGFPVSSTADITPGTATASGYYSYENVNYENLPKHGFVNNVALPAVEKTFDAGFSTALALETGLRFTLTDKIGLYTGLYFDYGLNSIQKTNDKHLLEYDITNESTLNNSVLNTGLTDKVNLFSIGLKVRVSLNL